MNPWEEYAEEGAIVAVEEPMAAQPWEEDWSEAAAPVEAAMPWEEPWETDVPEAPAAPSFESQEVRAPHGFWETIRDPMTNIKEDSIAANMIQYFTTPDEEFDARNKQERGDAISATPALSSLNRQLDKYEMMINDGTATEAQIDEFEILQDAYGDMYQKLDSEFETNTGSAGDIVDGLIESFSNDPGGMTAELMNSMMASPELMLTPVGWEKAAASVALKGASKPVQALAGAGGAASVSGGISAAESTSRGLKETGEVDASAVGVDTAIGAVLGPLTIGTVKGVGKLNQVRAEKAFNKNVIKAETKVRERAIELIEDSHLRQMPTEQAVRRAMVETKMSSDVRAKLAETDPAMSEKYFISDEEVLAKGGQLADEMMTLKGRAKKGLKTVGTVIDDTIGAVTTRLSVIHPQLGHALKRHDMQQAARIKSWLDIKDEYKSVMESLPNKVAAKGGLTIRTKAEQLINNSEPAKVRDWLVDNKIPDVDSKMAVIQKVYDKLDRDFVDAQQAGIQLSGDVGQKYFPRTIKNYEALMQRRGYDNLEVHKALAKYINRKYKALDKKWSPVSATVLDRKAVKKYLSDKEVTKALNDYYGTSAYKKTATSTTHTAKRVFDRVASNEMVDYADTVEALNEYIINMSGKIQVGKFFGGKAVGQGDEGVKESIGRYAADMYTKGKIADADQDIIKKLLYARFVESAQQTSPAIAMLKDVQYMATLANPFSAATQLGDLGSAIYLTSAADSLVAVNKVLSGKAEIDMKELGLDNIVQEFEHLRSTAKILKGSLMASGFAAVDKLGKNTILNASLRQYRRMAKSGKGRTDIRDKYRDAFTPDQMNKVLDDLEKGNVITDDIKYLAWHELSRAQPISMSEMPLHYLKHPNGRMFYALKTFTIKQIDAVRRDAWMEMRAGKPGKATKNLLTHAGILGVSNAGVEELKAWMEGKETAEFDDVVITTMMRNYGASSYLLTREKPSEAFLSLMLPPILGVADDFLGFLMGSDTPMQSLTPLLGSIGE